MLANLWDQHGDLLNGENNPQELFQLVKPYLDNLYDNTIIYHERHIYVAKLKDIVLDEKGFGANAENVGMIRQLTKKFFDQWSFNCTWELYRLHGSWLMASPYIGYRLMIDHDLVAQILWCLKKDDLHQALALSKTREREGYAKMQQSWPNVSDEDPHEN